MLKELEKQKNCQVKNVNDVFGKQFYSVVVMQTLNFCQLGTDWNVKLSRNGVNFLGRHISYCMFSIHPDYVLRGDGVFGVNSVFFAGRWSETIFFNSINSSDVRIKSFVYGTPRFEKILQSRVSFPIGHRKTILWCPCHGKSSIYFFWDQMDFLCKYFRVILKIHPSSFLEDNCLRGIILSHRGIELDEVSEASELFPEADFVFCDTGGSVFSAIYCDKNVLFLNTPDVPLRYPEIQLREEIINFDRNCSGEEILESLRNTSIWEKQRVIRRRIKERFFAISDEPASKKIARKLVEFLDET